MGEGWEVEVGEASAVALDVAAADGQHLAATLSVSEGPAPFTVSRHSVDIGDDLSLDARRAATATEVDTAAASGQAQRLALSWPDDTWPDDTDTTALSTRWMSAGGQGTLLEVEAFAADVLAEEVVFEDGEVLSREDSGPGIYTQLALVIDGRGGNRWSWVDAAIGVEDLLIHHEDRLLSLDVDTSTGLVAVTLEQTDDLWGIAPADPLAVSDLAEQDALPCAPVDQPFRLAWIVEGRCSRPDVVGSRVVLEVR